MATIKKLNVPTHEEVISFHDQEAGLTGIIAIHDTTLGLALGGTRMMAYQSEEEALTDVLRLSRGMTYKAAAADLDFGGGKAVIIGDPNRHKSEKALVAFGRVLESLNGRFMTGEDVGTNSHDMRIVSRETKYVIYPPESVEARLPTSYLTALGVLRGIQIAVKERYGSGSLSGIRAAIQGVGKVGYQLARMLQAEGAELIITDTDHRRLSNIAEGLNAQTITPGEIYEAEAEIFSPCALGGILGDEVIAKLKCGIVAGSANNQLSDERHGDELFKRKILYAPDYVINSGGLISALHEMGRCDEAAVIARIEEVYGRLGKIFEISRQRNIPPDLVADRLVEKRIESAKRQKAAQR